MKLLKWLSVADRYAKTYLDSRLAPYGINSSQHMYLIKICNNPGISQDALVASFYVHPSNVIRMIASLENKGFLTRKENEKDKRTCNLFATEKAISILPQIIKACDDTDAILTRLLSDEEKDGFECAVLQAGKEIAKEIGIERIGDEYDE